VGVAPAFKSRYPSAPASRRRRLFIERLKKLQLKVFYRRDAETQRKKVKGKYKAQIYFLFYLFSFGLKTPRLRVSAVQIFLDYEQIK
jgi:hypothetical protein